MDDYKHFLSIVEGSEPVAVRWSELVQKAISDARDKGVSLEPDDCLEIRELRLAAMGAPLSEDSYQRELMDLPAMSDAAKAKAIAEGDEEVRANAVADLYRDADKVHPDRHAAHAANRLSRARELGIASGPVSDDSADRDEKLRILRDEIEDHQTRLRLGRKWGLI